MKVCYRETNFSAGSMALIQIANEIIEEYQSLGYTLTLRQLYYRFVAGGYIANKDTEYKRLGDVVQKARYAGLIDWDAIEDRTRNVHSNSHWETPHSIVRAAAHSYALDKWADQPYRVEVWVEKEALAGIVAQVAQELDVNYLACRGYMSASEMRVAAQRLMDCQPDQAPIILHLGDHDPSGIDMTRDIEDRLREFCEYDGWDCPRVRRIALNMDQVLAYNPPPNPAKLTDSRCTGYMERFGNESWELDALPPNDLADLIRTNVLRFRDEELWAAQLAREEEERRHLQVAADRWSELVAVIDERWLNGN